MPFSKFTESCRGLPLIFLQESQVLYTDQWDTMTRDLHVIRAHLLYFTSLLVDFNKSIGFILQTPNPSFQLSSEDNQGVGDDVDQSEESDNRRKHSENLMNRECHTLLTQIERLEASRVMMELRLKNVMRLVSCVFQFGKAVDFQ